MSTSVFHPYPNFCVKTQLLPHVYCHSAASLEEYTSERIKREPITLTLAMFMGISMAVGVGTGVTALVEGRQGIQSLRDTVNEDLEMLKFY